MKFSVNIDINSSAVVNRICNNPEVGTYLAELWGREMDPFVPMRTGVLKDSWRQFREPFVINYKTPYAKVMFYGFMRGRRINYNKGLHPLATSQWHKAAENAKKDKVARELTEFIKRM